MPSHHYQTNSPHCISNFHPSEGGIPRINQYQSAHQSIPSLVASAATQEVGETVQHQKASIVVACRTQLPRFCTLTVLWTLFNPLSSCAEFHIYPRVAVPSYTTSSLIIHFLLRHTSPPLHCWYLYVFQNATETNESIFNCHCNCYPCSSREE